MRYSIHEDNLDAFESKIKRIQNKCKKCGQVFEYAQIDESYKSIEDGCVTYAHRFVEVEVRGTIKQDGWKVIARIDRSSDGVIVDYFDGVVDIPAKYTAVDYTDCEHCNTRRHRNHLYILKHDESDEYKQVGATCMKEFTHGLSAEFLSNYLLQQDELSECANVQGGAHSARYFEVDKFLVCAAGCVRKFGYVSSSNYEGAPTGERAFRMFVATDELTRAVRSDTENIKLAETAIEYVRLLDESNDYIDKIRTRIQHNHFKENEANLIASIIRCYTSHIDKLNKQEEMKLLKTSEYIGQPGDKIDVTVASIKYITLFESAYGTSYLYKINTADGNILSWFSSRLLSDDELKCTRLAAKVKAHNEYSGVKETQVNYCKLTD